MSNNAMVIDLSNYKDRVGSRVLPGRYRVQVEDVEPDNSKAGNQMINLWFRIVGGEFDGQTLVDRLTITEKALFRVVGFMQAIGLQTPKKRIQIDPRKFLGQVLDVDVDDGDPYNGRVKSEVRGYIRVPKEARNSGADVEDVTESVEAEAVAEEVIAGSGIAPTVVPSSAPAAAESEDDGIDLDNMEL